MVEINCTNDCKSFSLFVAVVLVKNLCAELRTSVSLFFMCACVCARNSSSKNSHTDMCVRVADAQHAGEYRNYKIQLVDEGGSNVAYNVIASTFRNDKRVNALSHE